MKDYLVQEIFQYEGLFNLKIGVYNYLKHNFKKKSLLLRNLNRRGSKKKGKRSTQTLKGNRKDY